MRTLEYREAIKEMKSRATELLQPDGSGTGWVCPICGSGTGPNGTGMYTKDNIRFVCPRGCFETTVKTKDGEKTVQGADIIGIIGAMEGKSGIAAVKATAKHFAIQLKYDGKKEPTAEELNIGNVKLKEPEPDYTEYYKACNARLNETDYHRGLSLDTLNRFLCGYDPAWKHPKVLAEGKNPPASPRLIIPTGRHSYIARDTRADLTDAQKKYAKQKAGNMELLNIKALQTATSPIFIVEGEIDALSIIDVGGEAIGLGSTSMVNHFLQAAKEHKPAQPLIIALDNDKAGQEAAGKLEAGLNKAEITSYRIDPANLYGKAKDANEALQTNRKEFSRIITTISTAPDIESIILEMSRAQLKQESVGHSMQGFIDAIAASADKPIISTGFKQLDSMLNGGLHAGLYTIGAISSLGKTTFCHQVADNIARNGGHVLFFSLEMATNELIAKSVSRITFQKDPTLDKRNAKTTRGILTGRNYRFYSPAERELIESSISEYMTISEGHVWITEGIGNVGVDAIKAKVEAFIRTYKAAPVVIIDYLQIIAPYSEKYSDKQNTDKNVLELKRLSRDYDIPIIGISSFNRANYTEPVNMSAFKESGSLEYGSDVLMGLQYDGMDWADTDTTPAKRAGRIGKLMKEAKEAAKEKRAQSIQLKILKNRNGAVGDVILGFYPMFNYFVDLGDGWTIGSKQTDPEPEAQEWQGFTEDLKQDIGLEDETDEWQD